MKVIRDVSSTQIDELKPLYQKVDGYQPVYGLEEFFVERPVSRSCVDRCELLKRDLGRSPKNVRIIDVGCSMGYISLYLSELGVNVFAIDTNQDNVNFSQTLAKILNIKCNFSRRTFDLHFCRSIAHGQYDVAIIFSLLHHVIHEWGLTKTQLMMREILTKVDCLYVELASKQENVRFAWRQSLPDDELAIFAHLDDLQIECIGRFTALSETVERNLYRITNNSMIVNNIIHRNVKVSRSLINDGRTRDKKYYISDSIFTKCFNVDRGIQHTYANFARELTAHRLIGRSRHFQRVLEYGIEGSICSISFPRLRGRTLHSLIDAGEALPLRPVCLSILSILLSFQRAGLFWNDLRSHNLILEGDSLIAIDLEFAAPIEAENTLNVFLWLVYDLQSRRRRSVELNAFGNDAARTPLPPIPLADYDPQITDIADNALRAANIGALLTLTESISV